MVSGQLAHQVGQAVCNGVELVLCGFIRALLRVLQQHHQQECDDRGERVDDQLSGVHIPEQEKRRRP